MPTKNPDYDPNKPSDGAPQRGRKGGFGPAEGAPSDPGQGGRSGGRDGNGGGGGGRGGGGNGGGGGRGGRGGVEGADGYEWGGKNADSKDTLAEKRPGWSMPIHQLLVKYKVSAVFHDHDLVYAHQTKDGIIYQELPQPSHGRGGAIGSAAEYGYVSGTILPGSGVMRVDIAPDRATFTFLRTDRGKPEKAHEFVISPKK